MYVYIYMKVCIQGRLNGKITSRRGVSYFGRLKDPKDASFAASTPPQEGFNAVKYLLNDLPRESRDLRHGHECLWTPVTRKRNNVCKPSTERVFRQCDPRVLNELISIKDSTLYIHRPPPQFLGTCTKCFSGLYTVNFQ